MVKQHKVIVTPAFQQRYVDFVGCAGSHVRLIYTVSTPQRQMLVIDIFVQKILKQVEFAHAQQYSYDPSPDNDLINFEPEVVIIAWLVGFSDQSLNGLDAEYGFQLVYG
jgi:hypothetical protein